jgi:hypothetical protein
MREVFIGTERLVSGGLTRSQLRWNYEAIFPGVYAPRAGLTDLSSRIAGAWLWSGRDGIIAGRAAASLHGAEWIDANTPIELIGGRDRSPSGIVVRSERIDTDEIVEIDGMLVTSPARTALDLGRHLQRDEAVRHLDALARVSRIGPADALSLVARHRRARGLRRAEIALDLMDGGSQSPMETRLRLWYIDAGFPRPTTQIRVTDGFANAFLDWGSPRLRGRVGRNRWSAPITTASNTAAVARDTSTTSAATNSSGARAGSTYTSLRNTRGDSSSRARQTRSSDEAIR